MLNLKMLSDGVGIKMLGVHEGRPVPPVYTTCRRGMKRIDRFFYVKSGVINFDLPDGAGLYGGDVLPLLRGGVSGPDRGRGRALPLAAEA